MVVEGVGAGMRWFDVIYSLIKVSLIRRDGKKKILPNGGWIQEVVARCKLLNSSQEDVAFIDCGNIPANFLRSAAASTSSC
jgi:hypothetical protein